MEKEQNQSNGKETADDSEDTEPIELVVFQVSECYVYMIPPRKTAASYRFFIFLFRADEWDVNKWAWEGALKVLSKGEECIIRLEDKSTGELYARAFLRKGEPHPVEPVIDSSRYFVLRIEENIDGRLRHAFIGIGFRERPQAYDFQAALHDHMKYLNKKETAMEMEQQFQRTSSIDYSLKDGETLILQLKNKAGCSMKSKYLEPGASMLSPRERTSNEKEPSLSIKLPPPPPATLSTATNTGQSEHNRSSNSGVDKNAKEEKRAPGEDSSRYDHSDSIENQSSEDLPDDDFGDFQTAG